jgi:hypothetical protein
MLQPQQLNDLLAQLTLAITQLQSHHLIIDEPHLIHRLKNAPQDQFPTLVAVMPNANGSPSRTSDNVKYSNTLLFYILKKINYPNRTFLQELADYQDTHAILLEVIEQLQQLAHTNCLYQQFQFPTLTIDPVYQYQGCDGWALIISLTTPHPTT